jgi:hypothetical protein
MTVLPFTVMDTVVISFSPSAGFQQRVDDAVQRPRTPD